MSVVGLDFGNLNCVVAVARKRGIDVIANEASRRETPSLVSFKDDQRYIGESAATSMTSNLQNTITNIKRLIGRKYSEPGVQEEIKGLNYTVTQLENDNIGIEVYYQGENKVFLPEQITAMLFNQMRRIVELDSNRQIKVQEIVISVPSFFTDAQRRAVKDAAEIAGLSCTQLLSESTAVAIPWGMYKQDLPADSAPLHVLFVDFGESTFTATVVAFSNTSLNVISSVADPTIGGRNFDKILFDYFNQTISNEFKLDISKNKRAQFRVLQQCERVKRVLTTNPEAPFFVEALMNDKDVRGIVQRNEFEKLCQPFLDTALAVVEKAIAEAKLEKAVDIIEVSGSSSYIPAFQSKVAEKLKKEVSQTQNKSEAVARGCALQCALLSPQFKFNRTVTLRDYNPYSIRITYWEINPDGQKSQVKSAVLFKKGDFIPSAKKITFPRAQTIEIEVDYANEEEFLFKPNSMRIGSFKIPKFEKTVNAEEADPIKIEVKFEIDASGIFSLVNARALETYVEVEQPKAAPAEQPAAATPETANPAAPATPEVEKKDGDGDAVMAEEKKEEVVKKKKTKTTNINVTVSLASGLSKDKIRELKKIEADLLAADELAAATSEAKNALEAYSYEVQGKLQYDGSEWCDYVTTEERSKILADIDDVLGWLYGDGDATTKQVYESRLSQLKTLGDPVSLRKTEDETRGPAIEILKQQINHYKDFVASQDEKYSHIPPEERQKVQDKINETEDWLNKLIAKQNELPKTSPPILLTSAIVEKNDLLVKFSNPIVNKVKPPPPKVEPPAPAPATTPETAPAGEPQQAPMETETPAPAESTSAPEQPKQEPVPSEMDVD